MQRTGEQQQLWRLFTTVLVFWGILLASIGIGGFIAVKGEISSPALDLVISAFDAVVIVLFCCAHSDEVGPRLRRSGFGASTWWYPPAALVAMGVFFALYFAALSLLVEHRDDILGRFAEHGWPLWSAFVSICIVPGIFEELAFRGFILGRLLRVTRPGEALLIQAAMFSVLHLSPLIFISHFVMGLILGHLALRTRSLYPSMVVHMAWNAAVLAEELMREGGY